MSTSITDNPMVKSLTKMFDLEVPASHRMVVTDWSFEDGKFVVKSIDVYDTDNKFVKKADMGLLHKNAHKFSFIFKEASK